MQITLFSIIFIILYCFIFVKNRNYKKIYVKLLSIAIILELGVDIGFFIKIGDFSIGYGELSLIIVFVFSLFNTTKINKKYISIFLFIMISVLLGMILAFIIPYGGLVFKEENYWDQYYFWNIVPEPLRIDGKSIKEFVHLLIFIILLIKTFTILQSDDFSSVASECLKLNKFLILWGGLEVIIILLLKNPNLYRNICVEMFGDLYINDYSTLNSRLRGLKSEPSFYAYMLSISLLLTALYEKNHYKRIAWIVYIGAIMFLSKSFLLLICILFIISFYLTYRSIYKIKIKKNMILLSLISIIVILLYIFFKYRNDISNDYLNRFKSLSLVLSNLRIDGWEGNEAYLYIDSSSRIRIISILGAFYQYFHRPLFGLGIGTNYTHGSLPTVISQIGLIATVLIYYLTFFAYSHNSNKYKFVLSIWFICQIFITNGLFSLYGAQNILLFILFSKLNVQGEKLQYEKN